MSKKKTENNLIEVAYKVMEEQDAEVDSACSNFYEDGKLVNFEFLTNNNTTEALLMKGMAGTSLSNELEQKQLENTAFSIKNNVKQGKPNNIEIRFDQMIQWFEGRKYLLGNTAVKIRVRKEDALPNWFFLKDGNGIDVRAFLGGDDAAAVMAIRNESGEVNYISLAELQLLSIQQNPDPKKEVGLLTSYIWLTARVHSSVIFASSLWPIKDLLLSEWLLSEWKRVKDAGEHSSVEVSGGDANE